MLMGKGYNLLARSSGRVPGGCTTASLTARFSSFDDAAADAEHEEMVNEFQAMVLIGKQWANAPDNPTDQDDNPLPSNFDPETATIKRSANEDSDNWNSVNQSRADDENASGPATEKIETFEEDDSKNLYSTVGTTTSIVHSSLQTANSTPVVERPSPTCRRDELLPLPVYEDSRPPCELPSPSWTRTGDQQLQSHASDVEISVDVEEPIDVEFQATTIGCDEDNRSTVRRIQEEGDDKELEGLKELEVERRRDDNGSSSPQPPPRVSSSLRRKRLSNATPRRSSQLSDTLRNNLERLLQRGPVPVSTTKTGSGHRRKTKRDEGLASSDKQQTTTSRDRKQQHRHRHHHHHHRHHHHQQHQQQEKHRESELYSMQDDVQSLMSEDTCTVGSLSTSSVSGISSISEGMLPAFFSCRFAFGSFR